MIKLLWKRPAETWLEIIDQVTDDPICRWRLACIVWWDFFGLKPREECLELYRRMHAKNYPSKYHPTKEVLYILLLSIGYPIQKAKTKCVVDQKKETEPISVR